LSDLTVSLVQIGANVPDKAALLRELSDAISPETDVMMFHGTWTGGRDESRRCAKILSEICAARRLYAVSGWLPHAEGNRSVLRAWIFDDSGRAFAYCDKTHLRSQTGEDKIYAPGGGPAIFDIGDAACAVLSGYDMLFPEYCRQISIAGARIFFVAANWPDESASMWEPMIRSVAFTNQCFVAACNATGNSAVVSPFGEIIAATGGGEGVLSVSLRLPETSVCRKNLPLERDRRAGIYAIIP
jgi:predicted amidohydrolase